MVQQEYNLHDKSAASWAYGDFGGCVNLLQSCHELAASLQTCNARQLQVKIAIWVFGCATEEEICIAPETQAILAERVEL